MNLNELINEKILKINKAEMALGEDGMSRPVIRKYIESQHQAMVELQMLLVDLISKEFPDHGLKGIDDILNSYTCEVKVIPNVS